MMKNPLHGGQNVVRFQDQSAVDRYHLRPTYPPETFELLNALIIDEPRAVLDVGCGTGNVARHLAAYAEVMRGPPGVLLVIVIGKESI